MMPRLSPLAFLLSALPLAACADDRGAVVDDGPCAALREECFSGQKVCVEKAEGPVCEPCGPARYASAQGVCEELPGTAHEHQFAEFTVKAGEEIKSLCQSWTLNNPEEMWINAVELSQDASSHHSNWTFVPNTMFEGPDGVWPCHERGYSQLEAAIYGGVVYAQSTQAAHEVQKFPNGAAVRIPPWSRIIGDVHLLNTTTSDVTGNATLTLYELPAADVQVKLTPFHLSYEGLNIPPHADSRFVGEAPLRDKFKALGNPFEMNIYFVLPHYHSLGQSFFLDVMGGPDDGERVFEIGAYDGEAHGKSYDPPFAVTDAEGFTFGCQFTNPRDEYIQYGLGDQEMCECLGFAESRVAFEGVVDEAIPDGTDGAVQIFTGEAATLAFEWTHDKAGGEAP